MEPFVIDVPDSQLADLERRLAATRYPRESRVTDWSHGMPASALRELIEAWRSRFDWRVQEKRLNGYEQFTTEIDGSCVHFVRARASRPGRLPIVLTHGWPYSFAEMLPLLDALNGELDVIIPSLPGFTFSEPLPVAFSESAVAERWHTLMTGVLGYERYLTYGEDVGAGVSDWLAGLHPESVAGIVASHASFSAREREGVSLDEYEDALLRAARRPMAHGERLRQHAGHPPGHAGRRAHRLTSRIAGVDWREARGVERRRRIHCVRDRQPVDNGDALLDHRLDRHELPAVQRPA